MTRALNGSSTMKHLARIALGCLIAARNWLTSRASPLPRPQRTLSAARNEAGA